MLEVRSCNSKDEWIYPKVSNLPASLSSLSRGGSGRLRQVKGATELGIAALNMNSSTWEVEAEGSSTLVQAGLDRKNLSQKKNTTHYRAEELTNTS